jgi:hypothetical protein
VARNCAAGAVLVELHQERAIGSFAGVWPSESRVGTLRDSERASDARECEVERRGIVPPEPSWLIYTKNERLEALLEYGRANSELGL